MGLNNLCLSMLKVITGAYLHLKTIVAVLTQVELDGMSTCLSSVPLICEIT